VLSFAPFALAIRLGARPRARADANDAASGVTHIPDLQLA
jgi:hypothetical protein